MVVKGEACFVCMQLSMKSTDTTSKGIIMPDFLCSSADFSLPYNPEIIDKFVYDDKMISHMVHELYSLVKCLRPDKLDDKEKCLVLDIDVDDEFYDFYDVYVTMSKDTCTYRVEEDDDY